MGVEAAFTFFCSSNSSLWGRGGSKALCVCVCARALLCVCVAAVIVSACCMLQGVLLCTQDNLQNPSPRLLPPTMIS